jgi:hypothetical protein
MRLHSPAFACRYTLEVPHKLNGENAYKRLQTLTAVQLHAHFKFKTITILDDSPFQHARTYDHEGRGKWKPVCIAIHDIIIERHIWTSERSVGNTLP